MKKLLYLALTLAVLLPAGALAQDQEQTQEQPQEQLERRYTMYGVMFYNLENLFDTIHDEGKNDYEYLPDGGNKWTAYK